ASESSKKARVKFIENGHTPENVQRLQMDLLNSINQTHLADAGPNAMLEGRINSFELAFRMQEGMPEIENLDSESQATQAMYGLDDPVTEEFGRQCLMARRFAERGVRFIQCTHSDTKVQWDQHGD